MAQVRLWINPRDKVIYDLPRVCMKCGADATTVRKKQFSWYPPWVFALVFLGLWPFLIVALILTKRQTVEAPFCEQHKNHWLIRILVGAGVLVALVGVGALAFAMAQGIAPNGKGDDLTGFLCLGWFVALLFVAIGLGVFNTMTTIRTTQITERDITLTNVSPDFAGAVEEEEAELERDADGEVRDRWREKRRGEPRRDDDRYERGDRPPRKRSRDIREEEDE